MKGLSLIMMTVIRIKALLSIILPLMVLVATVLKITKALLLTILPLTVMVVKVLGATKALLLLLTVGLMTQVL